jgi:hypothetical protein
MAHFGLPRVKTGETKHKKGSGSALREKSSAIALGFLYRGMIAMF